ncbi:phosphopantetheine-binding protein [Streptomyces sp. NPDC059917]|uniref:phosphopantetheine-binding protein n=1 Tax=Streptomyces sp. NPDC059917 TaxID=3347002 RepID=UPI003652A66D
MTQNRIRHELQSIWIAVLGVPQVGGTDDFFDLGGDSLAAARMTSLAQSADIPLRAMDVLKNPRFADLVTAVEGKVVDAPR